MARRSEASRKCRQTRIHAHAAASNRFFEIRPLKGKGAGSGQPSKQRRADHAAFLSAISAQIRVAGMFRRLTGRFRAVAAESPAIAHAAFSRPWNTRDVWRRSTSLRSGVTKPRCIARPASMNSEAITISTSPGKGISSRTGSVPSLRRRASAKIST